MSVFHLAVALWNFLFRPSVCPREDNPSIVLLAALIALAGAPAGLLPRSRQLRIDAHARYLCNGSREGLRRSSLLGFASSYRAKGIQNGGMIVLKGPISFWLLKITIKYVLA